MSTPTTTSNEDAMQSPAVRRVVVCNRRGLHARAAAKFVKLVGEFRGAQVTVVRRDQQVPGGSIMGLMMLAAGPGCEIELRAEGPQAEAALDALVDLVQRKFDED